MKDLLLPVLIERFKIERFKNEGFKIGRFKNEGFNIERFKIEIYRMEEIMIKDQSQVKKAEDSRTENSYLLMPGHINGYGRLFGGMLMQWIDEIAGIVAKRHAQTEVTTAAIDNLQFKSAAYLNQTVVLIGKITYVGRTSMEVRVDTYVEELNGTRKVINRAYVVMVAIDKEGNPVRIPGLALETEAARAEWEGGEKRYQLRKTRRQEGY